MKKYKLIKKYPGSPEIDYIRVCNIDDLQTIHSYNSLIYQEFWQEVVEKEYEILSIRDKCVGWIHNLIENSDIFRYLVGENNVCDITLSIFKSKFGINYEIYSVKRLSDGEVFIRDQLIYSKFWDTSGNIIKLHLVGETLYYDSKNGNKQFSSVLSNLQIIKQKLFTTEDGVDIFQGDKIFEVSDYVINARIANDYKTSHPDHPVEHWYKDDIYFSTKEKAEEYIILNKPCLCLNEINNSINKLSKDHWLYKLVKSKLNIK